MATFTKVVIKQGSGVPVATGKTVTVHALGQQLVNGEKVKFW
jgi:FKBP-type peptidyl-prolyl cis-trans isomerase